MKRIFFVIFCLISGEAFSSSWAEMSEGLFVPSQSLSSDSDEESSSEASNEVPPRVLALSAPNPYRKKSSSPLIMLLSKSLSMSPSRYNSMDEIPGTESGDCYNRLKEACKNGELTDQFHDDLRIGLDWINHSPSNKRDERDSNRTLLYYVISKCTLQEGKYANLETRLYMVKLLLLREADLNVVVNPDRENRGDSLLSIACLQSHEDMVYLLLEKGADIHFKDYRGWGVLHVAAANVGRSEQVLRKLLEFSDNLDINNLNDEGNTPLDIAIHREHQNAIDYLKGLGAKTSKELEMESE